MTFEEALEVTKIHSIAGYSSSGGVASDAQAFQEPASYHLRRGACGRGGDTKARRDKPGTLRRPVS